VIDLRSRLRAPLLALAQRVSRRLYWNLRARDIDARWGRDSSDHALLGELLDRVKPKRVLDIGCGTGRLFAVFEAHGVEEVMGQDVSRWALDEARRRFPSPIFSFTDCPLAALEYGTRHFDLCVSNRVLSAVPRDQIREVLAKLASVSVHLYLNEFSTSDDGSESSYWFRHDYLRLLAEVATFTVLATGVHGRGTYYLIRLDALP